MTRVDSREVKHIKGDGYKQVNNVRKTMAQQPDRTLCAFVRGTHTYTHKTRLTLSIFDNDKIYSYFRCSNWSHVLVRMCRYILMKQACQTVVTVTELILNFIIF